MAKRVKAPRRSSAEPAPSAEDLAAVPVECAPGPPVAGMCASAGGLEAFKRFFSAMPASSGVAFVLIPHLDPSHDSLMVELLTRHTAMPVVEAVEGMAVEADHVYVLPPNRYLTIAGGELHLTGPVERRGLQTSMDLFLRSLAEDRQERAICVILSGTGSHGTLGLKAVKASGGMAMVQDPATADYDRMPRSAIATGLADFVLPPESMPEELIRYVRYFHLGGAETADVAQTTDELEELLSLLRIRTRLDFRCYRKKMLLRRIGRRLSLGHFERADDYLVFLREHPEELQRLARDLLISVTGFFRDPQAFHALETEVIGPLVRTRESDAPVRVWVPGSATGEEAYSIAMLILEQLMAEGKSCPLQVFATDVDRDALDVGRQGVYPDSISADVTAERLARFFVRVDETSYRVNPLLRESVVFAAQNLVTDAPFSRLDLIACRNLLIYLEPEVQHKIIALFHFALSEGGHLVLGPSETIGRQVDLFEPVSKKWRIFRRVGPDRPERVEFPITVRLEPLGRSRRPVAAAEAAGFAEVARQLLLEEFAPAAVLVNRTLEILYFFGPTTRYLELPTGAPTRNLLLMVREGLRTKLRTALHKALRDGEVVTLAEARVRRDGGYFPVRVMIRPVQGPGTAEDLLLVTFHDLAEAPVQPAPVEAPEESVASQLELELKVTREELQGAVEELESSNEELKAGNEELASMNEELQSANEELETSKEELQSLNEELTTVNQQLQDKVEELRSTNDDIANLLASTEIATVFLDTGMRIRQFTPAMARLVELIDGDVGRPITTFAPTFIGGDLTADGRQVLESLAPVEREITAANGRTYLRRILPYRTADNGVEGVVVAFVDITERMAAEAESRRLATVLRDSNDAVMLLDLEGRITAWNRGAERTYGFSEGDALGMNLRELVPEELRAEAEQLLQRVVRGEDTSSFTTQRLTRDRRRLDVWITATRLTDELGEPTAVAMTDRDLTDLQHAQELLRITLHRKEVVELFLKEIHHRVKNNLQVVASLVRLQADSVHDPALRRLFESVQDQVRSMALVHEKLYQTGDLARMNFAEYAQGLLGQIWNEHQDLAGKIRLSLELQPLSLPLDAAIPCGLVLNELASNALRHAFPGRDEGEVTVGFGAGEDGQVCLRVRDNGVGMPAGMDWQKRSSLGLRLVQALAGQLRGTVEVVSGPGTEVRVAFPVPAATGST